MRRPTSWLVVLMSFVALVLAACSSTTPLPPGPLFVNPTSGLDTGAGTSTEPLKTIGRAFELVKAGGEVYLQAGTYRDEAWPLTVPTDVTIGAVTAFDAVLVNEVAGAGTALTFTSDGVAKDLRIEDFAFGIDVTGGEVRLVGLEFVDIATQAVTASGSSDVTIQSSTFQNLALAGAVTAKESATVSLTGGSVTGGGTALAASGTAQLTVANLAISDADYGLYVYASDPTVTLSNVAITNTARSAVYVRDSASNVTLNSVVIDTVGEIGVSAYEYLGELRMTGGTVTGASAGRPAVEVAGNEALEQGGTLFIQGTQIVSNLGFGLQVSDFATADVRNASISSNAAEGVSFFEPAALLLRNTTVQFNGGRGLYLRGYLTVESMVSTVNLGTSADPGLNTIRANGQSGLYAFDSSVGVVQASGNTWNANTQGSSADGAMTVGVQLTGPVSGTNFTSNNALQFWF